MTTGNGMFFQTKSFVQMESESAVETRIVPLDEKHLVD